MIRIVLSIEETKYASQDIRSAIDSRSSRERDDGNTVQRIRPTAAAAVGGSEKYFSAKIRVPQRYTKGVKRAQLFKRLCSISNSGIYVERILTFEFSVRYFLLELYSCESH